MLGKPVRHSGSTRIWLCRSLPLRFDQWSRVVVVGGGGAGLDTGQGDRSKPACRRHHIARVPASLPAPAINVLSHASRPSSSAMAPLAPSESTEGDGEAVTILSAPGE